MHARSEPACAVENAEPMLSVRNLRVHYRSSRFGIERDVKAVDDVSFAVRRREIYGLAGESSAGKTTLTKSIAGAVRPPMVFVGGSVDFAFLSGYGGLHRAPPAEVARIRWRHLAYIMQSSMSLLNPVRQLRSTFIDFALPHIGGSRSQFEQEVVAHLARVQLDPSVLAAYPHQLSGGMRQRAILALATICRPDLLIADEPTSALDVLVQREVLGMIRGIQRETGSSVLLVSHDMGVHALATDRLGIMYAGRLVEEGATPEIFRSPLHPYTRHLISSLPRIGDDAPHEGLESAPPNLADPPSGCRFHPRCPLAREACRRQVPPMQEAAPGRRVACFALETGHRDE